MEIKYFKLNELKKNIKSLKKSINFKKNLIEKWNKITSTKYTRFFTITSIIQCITIIIFQSFIFFQNSNLYSDWDNNNKTYNAANHTDNCKNLDLPKFPYLTLDNVIFIVFQVFQLYFCFNAVLTEHIVQIITINVFNFGWSIYGFVQIYEVTTVSYELDDLANCIQSSDQTLHRSQDHKILLILDVLCTVLVFLFSIAVAFLSFKLYDQFGWNIYKKFGGDPKMQVIHKNYLAFLMLLKINLFATVLFLLASILISRMDRFTAIIPASELIFHYLATALVLFLEIVGYKLVEKEYKTGMIIFLVLWLAVIADFILVLVVLIYVFKLIGSFWIFGSVLVIVLILNSILLAIFGIKVLINFGKGLKDLRDKKPGPSEVPLNQLWNLDYEPNKMVIDT
ncbi:Golgi apparatus membrane protein [Gigaspora margarita]|uniref:Golgi apparatus membrane protein n=1 Tax=Gigaspora margarita TaxID=4874 RepID=A0A8H4AVY8_GIGMA|nr:Golgi apparatus membrane protein [Gigaspora margarita]